MREKLIYILIFGVILSSCNFTSAEEYVDMAHEYEEKGELLKAIESLDKAIEKKSNFRPALLNRGSYKSQLGKREDGILDYKKILSFDSGNTLALFNIGINYQELAEYEKAIDFFTRALKSDGVSSVIPNSDGGYLIMRANIDFDPLDNDMDFEVTKSEIEFSRGVNYFFDKQYDYAISDFENTIKANYEKVNSYFFLGEIYLKKEDFVKACDNYTLSANLGDLDAKEKLKKYCEE
jgi:tetratricopeptide (TPR) repeat protein